MPDGKDIILTLFPWYIALIVLRDAKLLHSTQDIVQLLRYALVWVIEEYILGNPK
jgi:hypothetical protein